MTPKEIFDKLIEKDSYEVMIWLQFIASKIDCKDCIDTKKMTSGIPPRCSDCGPAKSLIKKTFGKGGYRDA